MELLTRAGLIAGILLFVGVALAQGSDFDPSMLLLMFENPLIMITVMGGLIHAVRKALPRIDGPILTPLFGAALGAVVGAAGQAVSLLTVLPFAEWVFPWGGAAYGALASLSATIGFNLFEYAAALWNRGRADASTLALVATGQPVNAGAWVVQHARSLVPQNRVTPALEVLAPLIARVANQMLTDDLRAELQAKIHRTLKDAGLLRGRDFGDPA